MDKDRVEENQGNVDLNNEDEEDEELDEDEREAFLYLLAVRKEKKMLV